MNDPQSLRDFVLEILRDQPHATIEDIEILWTDANQGIGAQDLKKLPEIYESVRRELGLERLPPPGDPARFQRKYALWKERLLDLTAANRLLNFKPTKVATIGVTAPKVEDLYESLVVREQQLRFPLYRGRVVLAGPDEDADGDDSADEVPRYSVVPGDLEAAAKAPPELEKSLTRISALARSSKEERGINTLYLALGMLVWRPEEGANEQRAPLLLVPVELSREDRFHPYVLSVFDEDPELNPTLIFMLKRDFDFALPPFGPDPDGNPDDLISFFLRVQEATARARLARRGRRLVGTVQLQEACDVPRSGASRGAGS